MKVNFKQPRYMIPLIMLPFILIFSYVFTGNFGKEPPKNENKGSLQDNVAGVSDHVKNTSLTDKLGALQQEHREGDGYTAVGNIAEEQFQNQRMPDLYNLNEKRTLDSIEQVRKRMFGGSVYPQQGYSGFPGRSFHRDNPLGLGSRFPDAGSYNKSVYPDETDRQLALALARMKTPEASQRQPGPAAQPDPMELFRKQMSFVDSMGKANDPEYRAQQKKLGMQQQNEQAVKDQQKLNVSKAKTATTVFNTITADQDETFIRAIVDQDITAYAGSRLRIRLLDDMTAGSFLVKKGACLYAQISGFSGQRVALTVSSIMQDGHILPVKLQIYDLDGIPGLYVPASAFREFSKELGSDAGQGITLQQQAENNNQLVMSVLQKMFQSTTAAVSKLIRSNKANIKYNTLVYLIDPDELKTTQKNY